MSAGADELVAAYLRELEREAARLPWNARMELLEDVRSHIEVALAEMGSGEVGEAEGRGAGLGEADREAVGSREAPAEAEAKTTRVREILAALGEPREIVDAAAADEPGATIPPQSPPPGFPTGPIPEYPFAPTGPLNRLGTPEVWAVALLLFGTFLLGIGWIIGLILLWTSPRWTIREKLVGTFVLPGGLGFIALAATTPSTEKACTQDSTGVFHCSTSGWSLPGWAGLVIVALGIALPIYTSFFLVRRAHSRPWQPSRSERLLGPLMLGVLGSFVAIILLGAFAFVAVGHSGGGAATPSRVEPSEVASYPGTPFPPPPSESESGSAEPASSNSTSH